MTPYKIYKPAAAFKVCQKHSLSLMVPIVFLVTHDHVLQFPSWPHSTCLEESLSGGELFFLSVPKSVNFSVPLWWASSLTAMHCKDGFLSKSRKQIVSTQLCHTDAVFSVMPPNSAFQLLCHLCILTLHSHHSLEQCSLPVGIKKSFITVIHPDNYTR